MTQQLRPYFPRFPRHRRRYGVLGLLAAIACLVIGLAIAPPAAADWNNLATAEITLDELQTRMTLTYPTGVTAFADDDSSGRLSNDELARHREALTQQLEAAIALKDSRSQTPSLTIQPTVDVASTNARVAPNTHTTLQLVYAWATPPSGLIVNYTFLPADDPLASCLATIVQNGDLTTHVFTPQDRQLTVMPADSAPLGSRAWFLTLVGAFMWGAVHSLSPGHGKTLVGAYLVGERANPRHALFLALTTTLTHTIGVFALGLITLAAARYVLPEQIYPWLSLCSGGLIVYIGATLIAQRSQRQRPDHHGDQAHSHGQPGRQLAYAHGRDSGSDHGHGDPHHASHSHASHNHAYHEHSHGGHSHSHLPLASDGNDVTWRSLMMLGLSAGLVPCPAALVLLLGAIAFGNPISGLLLVVAFSLGLASVLAGLGLLLVSAKRMFKQVPMPRMQALQWLPLASAVGITVIGLGISTRSLMQLI
ncbi:sulfite exporter TauE/SafE family protein [Nodosilinea nodulosa]|uniref:HoxN/HupN/NixA family nickel/cobalt transporter n=1 Tax=Nodosilinea nodulosa TaxID=416001 RepID=UPI00035F0E7C|nr:sulfite exporter TauE/SafE family protein [Nodosilinea nodulosa]